MNKDLAITSQQFGLLVGIFFLGYSLFEIPSNLFLHKIGARIWIARILLTWGILATLTGFVHNVHQLYVVRFLLGLAEAGYFPGMVLYLTYWFRQREQAQAIALFLTAVPVTSIVGAPMSGLILDHVHWLGVGSWRWLLILEGIPAIACGFLTYFRLPSRPAEAKFLTEDERDWIIEELEREEQQKQGMQRIFRDTGVGQPEGVASGMYRVHSSYRVLLDELLDATRGEIALPPVHQHYRGDPRDDPAPCGFLGDDPSFPQFRSQDGAEISCGDSGTGRRNCFCVIGCNSFSFLFYHAFVIRSRGHLQLLGSFLGTA